MIDGRMYFIKKSKFLCTSRIKIKSKSNDHEIKIIKTKMEIK